MALTTIDTYGIKDGAVQIDDIGTLAGNLTINDSGKLRLGTGLDLQLWHDGSHSYIDNDTGWLYVGSDNYIFQNKEFNETHARFLHDGSVELYHNNVLTFQTESDGASIIGPEGSSAFLTFKADEGDDNADLFDIGVNNGGPFSIQNKASGSWETNIECNGNGNVELFYDNSKKLETASWGTQIHGVLATTSHVDIAADNAILKVGASADLQIYHDGSNSFISEAGTGVLKISGSAGVYINKHDNTETCAAFLHDAGCELYHNNVKKFETTADGIEVTGKIFSSSHIDLADSVKLLIGTGDDLQIYHDGSTTRIYNSTGALNLTSSDFTFNSVGNSEQLARFTHNGGCELYYDGTKKFETTSTGASITGSLGIGTASPGRQLVVNADSANTFIRIQSSDTGNAGLEFGDQSDSVQAAIYQNASDNSLRFNGYNNSERLRITSGGLLHAGDVATTNTWGVHSISLSGNNDATFAVPATLNIAGGTAYNTANMAGGGIRFVGKFNSSNSYTTFAHMGGVKENTDDGNYAGALTFHTRNNGGLGAERLRITSDGRLWLGISSWDGHASCDDLIIGDGSGHRGLTIYSGTASEGGIFFADGTSSNASYRGIVAYEHNNDAMTFRTAAAERLRITSGGQVNLGAASPTASENGQFNCYTTTSSGKAQFVHDAGTGGLRLAGTGAGSGANLVFSNDYNSGTFSDHWTLTHNGGDDSFRFLSGGTGGTERLRIDSDGNFVIKSASNYNGEQVGKFEWWNENGAGIMAKIACEREQSTGAPGALVFSTSSNVDTGANSSEGDIQEKLRIKSDGTVTMGKDNNPLSTTYTQTLDLRGRYVNAVGDIARLMFRNSTDSGGSSASIRARRFGDNYGTELTFYTQQYGGSSGGDGSARARITNNGATLQRVPVFGSKITYDGSTSQAKGVQGMGSVYINEFSGMSDSNDRFVAPYDGFYFLTFYTNVWKSSSGSVVLRWYKNGSNYSNSNHGTAVYHTHGGGGGWEHMSSQIVIELDANDYVQLYRDTENIRLDGNNYGTFGGFLVSAQTSAFS